MTKTVVITFDEFEISREEAISYMDNVVDAGAEVVLLSRKANTGTMGLITFTYMINVSLTNTNFQYNFNPITKNEFFEKLEEGRFLGEL